MWLPNSGLEALLGTHCLGQHIQPELQDHRIAETQSHNAPSWGV